MLPEGDAGSFKTVSATLEDKSFSPTSVITSGKAPLVPGGKVAAAARLTAEGTQLLAASLERARSIAALSIALNFNYATLAPAVHGTIDIDWSKLEIERESLRAEYKRRWSEPRDARLLHLQPIERTEYTYLRDEPRTNTIPENNVVKVRLTSWEPT
jgi:hypothetical protein